MTKRGARRWFLGGLGCALVAPGAWLLTFRPWAFPRKASSDELRLARRVAALLDASRELRSLEKHRQWTLTSRPGMPELLGELFAGFGIERALSWNDAELQRYLREATRADYQLGNIDNVGGWLLATTEARLCALVSELG